MSDNTNQSQDEQLNEADEADSKADAIAIFFIIAIAVLAMIYFVS